MPDIAVCFGPELEQRFGVELERHGYRIVLRAADAGEFEAAIAETSVQLAVSGAGPDALTAGLLAACDDAGVRLVAIASGDAERRHARGLGLHEVIDASADLADLEAALTGGIRTTPVAESDGRGETRGPVRAGEEPSFGDTGARARHGHRRVGTGGGAGAHDDRDRHRGRARRGGALCRSRRCRHPQRLRRTGPRPAR